MSVSLEETIAKLGEARKRGILGFCGIKLSHISKLLSELQERRKADNEIPFGDSYSFTELDSIINAYEVHGGYYKEVVELLKELQERRKQPEIIRCGECKYKKDHHYENPGEEPYIKSTCENKYGLVKNYQVHDWDFCSRAERKTDEQVQGL